MPEKQYLPAPPRDLTEEAAEALFREQFKLHQQAFRVAFDFLKAAYPPGSGAEYWKTTAEKATLLCAEHKDNPLTAVLLGAVLAYLEKTRVWWDEERRGDADNHG